jgi:hypothetical protein
LNNSSWWQGVEINFEIRGLGSWNFKIGQTCNSCLKSEGLSQKKENIFLNINCGKPAFRKIFLGVTI